MVFLTAARTRGETFGAATTSGDWFQSTTWVDAAGAAGVPAAGDAVFIGAAGFPEASAVSGATVTLSGNATVAGVNIGTRQATTGAGTLVLDAGGLLDTATLSVDASNGGTAVLIFSGGSATIGGELSLTGAAASISRTSGGFSAADLSIADTAAVTLSSADAISTSIAVTSGGSLGLGANRSLTGGVTVDGGTLDLEDFALTAGGSLTLADGGTVTRGAGAAGTLGAVGFSVTGTTSLTAVAGDALSGAGHVGGGGSLTANTPLAGLTSLTVTGTDSALVANAQLTGGVSAPVAVTEGGSLTINAGLTAGTLSVTSGTLELNGGALEVSSLSLGSAAIAASVSRGGGALDAGNATIAGGTPLTILPGDLLDSLAISDGTVTVSQAAGDASGLWIRTASDAALTVDVLGGLVLNFDGGAAGSTDWILKWSGNRLAALGSLLDDGYVTVNRSGYVVSYDAGQHATFVTVPEPGWPLCCLVGVAAAAGRLRRSPRP